MLKRFVFLLILTFAFSGGGFAQESPFGSLSSENEINDTAERLVLSVEGQNKAKYLEMLTNYKNLVSLYERSYGQRKIQLGTQVTARAKDVFVSKLGATKTYLFELQNDASQTGLLSDAGAFQATTVSNIYADFLGKYLPLIEQKKTHDEMISLSNEINKELTKFALGVRPQVSLISISYGQRIVGLIESRAPVIQAHITASADLGGEVQDIQAKFDSAMLDLEKAKDGYKEITVLAESGAPQDTKTYSNLLSKTTGANKNLRFAQDGLASVINDLQALYGQSPWLINKEQFNFEEISGGQ